MGRLILCQEYNVFVLKLDFEGGFFKQCRMINLFLDKSLVIVIITGELDL